MLRTNNFIKLNYGWIIVFTGLVAMALAYGSVLNSIGVFVVPLMDTFGYTTTEVSAIPSLISVGKIVGAIITAYVIRKKGVKTCMLCSASILALTAIVFSRCTTLIQFYVCAVVMGVATVGTAIIPISVLINNWFAYGKRNFPLSIALMGSGIGGLILNPFLNSIIQNWDWRIAFMTIGLLVAFIYIPVIGIFTVSTPEQINTVVIGESEATDNKISCGLTYEQAIKSKYFYTTALTIAIAAGTGASSVFYLVSYFIDIGFSATQAAMISGISIGCVAIGKVIIGWIGDKFSAATSAKIGFFSLTLVFVLLCFVAFSNLILILTVAVYGLGVGSITFLAPGLTNYYFGERDFTKIMGLMSMFAGIGSAVIPVIMGSIIDLTSSYITAWALLAVLTGFAGILISIMFSKYQKEMFSQSQAIAKG